MINPGFTNITLSGKYKETIQGSPTNTLLIIGTAVDGPLNQAVRVIDGSQIEKIFGPARYSNGYKNSSGVESGKYNGASIPLAVHTALRAGAKDILIVRATGAYATAATAFGSMLDIRAVYPGKIYNDVSVRVIDNTGSASGTVSVEVTQPSVKGGIFTKTFPDATTIEEMIAVINDAVENKTIKINPNTFISELSSTVADITPATVTLTGGANQTDAPGEALNGNLALYATKLTTEDTGTFDMLKGREIAFNECVLTGLYLDDEVVASDPTKSIAFNFAAWLEDMSLSVNPCVGKIACRPTGIPLNDTSALISYVNNSLLSETSGYYDTDRKITKAGAFLYDGFYKNTSEGQIDLGGRLMVCAGVDCIWTHPDIGKYIDSFHVWLAAKATTIPPERSMMRLPVETALGFSNELPRKYANKLSAGVGSDYASSISGKGAYVTLVANPDTPNGAKVVSDDATAATRNNYFRQAQPLAVANSIQADLRATLSKYLGSAASPQLLAAIQADVKAILEGYVTSGALDGGEGDGYAFQVLMPPGLDSALGILRVKLEIRPSSAIRAIVAEVVVQKGNN